MHEGTVLQTFYNGLVVYTPCNSLKVRQMSHMSCIDKQCSIVRKCKHCIAMVEVGPSTDIPPEWHCEHPQFAPRQRAVQWDLFTGIFLLRIEQHPIAVNGVRTVANINIAQGTTILLEKPLYKVPTLNADDINTAVAQLEDRALFYFKALYHRDKEEGEAVTAKDKVDVNCHNAASESDSVKWSGVSFYYSRTNHSCAPNVEHI